MRQYWDAGARANAAWYVDTSLEYGAPDIDRFFASGHRIVADVLGGAVPVAPVGHELAVEIGSGLGRIALALADRFDRVVGVDVSPEMVARARQYVQHPSVRFEVGDGVSLSGVADATADLVFSFTVFQHIPQVSTIERYLVESGRVLRPGGVLVFQWNNQSSEARWRLRRWALAALQRSGLRPERYRRHAPEFLGSCVSVRRIEAALARGGLRLVGTKGTGTLFAWGWAERQ